MRKSAFAALVFFALSATAADADGSDRPDWYRQLQAAARSLIGAPARDHEVIVPPGNIDPRMVVAPPGTGPMRIIIPPGERGR